ncbi:MAG: molybdenum cofactor guanylyltransferase MobA [Hyphomicrobium sp.]|jgi:molybdopterin-guanine dinucleotide biosynthesis protein A
MNSSEHVVGILLAGGKSSRMGGGDKCLRSVGGRPILARIIERLEPQVTGMVINANGEAARFAEFGLPVVADSIAGFVGPLAGIHAGLEWVKSNRPDVRYAITAPTDTPFLPADLVDRFIAQLKVSPSLLVARSDAGMHPVVALWPVELSTDLEDALRHGNRKAGEFVRQHSAIEVYFETAKVGGSLIDPFLNINEPEELSKADALLKEQML